MMKWSVGLIVVFMPCFAFALDETGPETPVSEASALATRCLSIEFNDALYERVRTGEVVLAPAPAVDWAALDAPFDDGELVLSIDPPPPARQKPYCDIALKLYGPNGIRIKGLLRPTQD